MTNKDSKLIFEAYIEENLTKFEKDRLTAAGIMPEVAAMEYLSYEDDLANITGVTPHNSWYDHGGYDELGDPDDNLEDEHIAVVMVIGSGAAVVLFVDLADIQYDEGVYHGLHGPAFDQPASEMSSSDIEAVKRHMLDDADTMKRLKDMARDADVPARDSDEEHYKRGVSPRDFM